MLPFSPWTPNVPADGDHRWFLQPDGTQQPCVVVPPDDQEGVTLGRRTWMLASGRPDPKCSREACVVSDTGCALGCRSLRQHPQDPIRYRHRASDPWTAISYGDTVFLRDGSQVALSRAIQFRVTQRAQRPPSTSWTRPRSLSHMDALRADTDLPAPPKRAKTEEEPQLSAPVLAPLPLPPATSSARHVCATNLSVVGYVPCADDTDDALIWRAEEALRRRLVCGFVFKALPDGDSWLALVLEACSAPDDAALRELFGQQFPIEDTLEACQARAALEQASLRASQVIFRASDSEKLLLSAFAQLADSTIEPAQQPSIVRTQLKHHQLQALRWMRAREMPVGGTLPPFWERRQRFGPCPWQAPLAYAWGSRHADASFAFLCVVWRFNKARGRYAFPRDLVSTILSMVPIESSYLHQLTEIETKRTPLPGRGGILADDMGLGKTLTAIALICSNAGAKLVREPDVCYSSSIYSDMLSKLDSSDSSSASGAPAAVEDEEAPLFNLVPSEPNRRPTLIVCPSSVLSNWEDQFVQHVGHTVCSVIVYHGQSRHMSSVQSLSNHDVVITTYGTMMSEFTPPRSDNKDEDHSNTNSNHPTLPLVSKLSRVKWRRVILDEAHYIRNPLTKAAKAVLRIDCWFRWALTGTPVQNRLKDLQPLFAFVQEEVFSDPAQFRQYITHPIEQGLAEGFARLRTLMLGCCLRRTKEDLLMHLPPKEVKVVRLNLAEEEKLQYAVLDGKCKDVFRLIAAASTIGNVHSFLLLLLLRLRQTCCHGVLCGNLDQLLARARRAVESGESIDNVMAGDDAELIRSGCSDCGARQGQLFVSAVCLHVMCSAHRDEACIAGSCLVCGESLEEADLRPCSLAAVAAAEDQCPPLGSERDSAKMQEVLRIVSGNKDDNVKTVVFSQFTSFLDLLEAMFRQANIRACRIDGTMSPAERRIAMESFNSSHPHSPTVMLASLHAAGCGINLLGGSSVVLSDPWWNPSAEEQAIDRVHRIGQTRPVSVYRLIVPNSVEERMLSIHDAKRELAGAALILRSPDEIRELRVQRMRALFGALRDDRD